MPNVIPGTNEARRIVLSILAFWLLGGTAGYFFDSAAAALLVLPGLIAVFIFYWTVYSVAARETGRSVWWYFIGFPRRGESFWERGREGWSVIFRIVDPRWWHEVVKRTGWPTFAIEALLISSLVYAVVSVAVVPSSAPS